MSRRPASVRGKDAFSRHRSGVQRHKKLRRFVAPGASAFGAPSAWLFLIRLHACRAGLRFTRQHKASLPFGPVNQGRSDVRTGKTFFSAKEMHR
jgi:hypothetical protein